MKNNSQESREPRGSSSAFPVDLKRTLRQSRPTAGRQHLKHWTGIAAFRTPLVKTVIP
jgi:hypothetical protein